MKCPGPAEIYGIWDGGCTRTATHVRRNNQERVACDVHANVANSVLDPKSEWFYVPIDWSPKE